MTAAPAQARLGGGHATDGGEGSSYLRDSSGPGSRSRPPKPQRPDPGSGKPTEDRPTDEENGPEDPSEE